MSENALPKGYEPHAVEDHWREYWEKNKTFTPDPDGPGEPFSIVIPPQTSRAHCTSATP